nr:hypothetical protein [Saprospiraceae bacterium]
MEGISLMYPAWMVLLCLLAGLFYGLFHYYKSHQFKDKGPWLTWLLFALRTTAVTCLALLLLSPLLKYFNHVEEKPVWVVALDNSQSVIMASDSLEMANLYSTLGEVGTNQSIETDFLLFGDELTYDHPDNSDFSAKSTDLSAVLKYIHNTYEGRNLAGVLIATDGIYNRGANPVYTPVHSGAPVHFLALGDTTVRRDLIVRRVLHNRIAYLGENFSFQVDVSARMASGSSTQLQIFAYRSNESTELIHSEEIDIDRDDFFQTVEVVSVANSPGLKRYRVVLSPVADELSLQNNSRDFYLEVLDNRKEVLVLGAVPHPDLGTIKTLVEGFKNYELSISTTENWDGNFDDYDLVILHQLPGRTSGNQRIVQQALDSEKPLFFILGNQSNIQQFNQSQDLLQITGGRNRQNDAVPLVNSTFNPFSFNTELYQRFRAFVPLKSPFGEYELSPAADVLMYQRIGQVETEMPLLAMGERSGKRIAVLTGEGIWRWRLFEFSSYQSTDATADALQKTLQFLSIAEDDRRLRVYTDNNLYDENERVIFEAEYYNASYQRINTPDLRLELTNQNGSTYSYTFDRRDDYYLLSAGPFSPGDYIFSAEVTAGMETFEARGGFTVRPIELESINLQASHGLLKQLSERFNGGVFYPDQAGDLNNLLFDDMDLRPVVHSSLRTNLVLNLFWVCLTLLLLLFTEWFLRRFFGSY